MLTPKRGHWIEFLNIGSRAPEKEICQYSKLFLQSHLQSQMVLQFGWILLYASHLNPALGQSETVSCLFTYAWLSTWLLFQEVRGIELVLVSQLTIWNFPHSNLWKLYWPSRTTSSSFRLIPLQSRWRVLIGMPFSQGIHTEPLCFDFFCLIGDRQLSLIFVGFHCEFQPHKNVLEVTWCKCTLVFYDI